MPNLSAQTSVRFTNAGILCAILVAAQHCAISDTAVGVSGWIRELVSWGLCRMAVPLFFLMSGFFLAGHIDESGWWKCAVLKRIRTLIIPMLLWSVVTWCMVTPLAVAANLLAHRSLMSNVTLLNGDLNIIPPVFWFLQTLFVYVILSPVFVFVLRLFGRVWLIVAFALYWSVYTFIWPMGVNGTVDWMVWRFSLEGLAYFSIGIYLRKENHWPDWLEHPPSRLWIRLSPIVVTLCAIIGTVIIGCSEQGQLNLRHFYIPLAMLGVWWLVPVRKCPFWLASAAFPIYVIHFIPCAYFKAVFKHFSFGVEAVDFIFRWLLVVACCLLFSLLLRRLFPRVSSVLFGGR